LSQRVDHQMPHRGQGGREARSKISGMQVTAERSRSQVRSWLWARVGMPLAATKSVSATPSGTCIGIDSASWGTAHLRVAPPRSGQWPRAAGSPWRRCNVVPVLRSIP
jgi:hypothetical protein